MTDVPRAEPEDDTPIERTYRRAGRASRMAVLEQFVARVREYGATAHTVTEYEVPVAVSAACRLRGVSSLLVPDGVPDVWLPPDVRAIRDVGLSNVELDAAEGVLTGCAAAIAQTGTIILDSGEAQGRRALSLLPDYHLCIVLAGQVVDLVPEAIDLLEPGAAAGRAITLISGPSATSDIELNRVEGVHGPRTLEILLVAADPVRGDA